MWLLKTINTMSKNGRNADIGAIVNTSGESLRVQGCQQYRGIPIAAPYGIAYNPPQGEESVIVPLESSGICLGVKSKNSALAEGEIMIYSSGGASITLKNDGSISINAESVSINGREIT